ncbi:MAG: FprA family A-type flavoprotein [Nitrospirae bacterium]|nr:FprA family A-type flavoprotein [Nitrospirota bacterium]
MNAIEIKPDIFWVGAIDWAMRDFHGIATPTGTTYNNYLILDDEVTLIDAVKYDFSDFGIGNVKGLIDPAKIKNIVVNHIEDDHMGALERFVTLIGPDNVTIYATAKGKEGMGKFFDATRWNIKVVKTGDELKIGKYTLLFIETPMLHWPDSMMTYVKGARLLISQDVFGQHLATTTRFDDEFVSGPCLNELDAAVIDYYANILMPFGKLIKAKLIQIQGMGLDIDMIAPDHGLIWRKYHQRPMDMYMDMANGKALLRVTIIYDTMWKNTEKMTLPIMQGIRQEGVDCKVVKLTTTPISVAITEYWKSRACLIGSSTLNNLALPSVAGFMYFLLSLRPKDRLMGAFGSYGWAGGAVKWLYDMYDTMKLPAIKPGPQVQFHPSLDDVDKCYEFGQNFAREVKQYHKGFE